MRRTPLPLLFSLLLAPNAVLAEDVSPQSPSEAATATTEAQLQQRLAHSEQLRSELEANGNAQSQRLRQEVQRLRLQLKESQAKPQPGLLSEKQTWFALGAGLSLISVVLGALLRRPRKNRREWIN